MLSDIVALNNRAISFLQQGNKVEHTKAVSYLREALCRLRKRIRHLKETDGENKLSSERVLVCNRLSNRTIKKYIRPRPSFVLNGERQHQHQQGPIVICKVPIAKKQQSPSSSCESNENLFSFYEQAFFVSPTMETISMEKKINTHMHVVLLYNMGLALHMEGTSSNSKSDLMKAQKFYEFAMSMIAVEWKDIDPYDFLLLLAVSNNLGHIHSHLLNFSATQKCLAWLRNLMKAYQQCNKMGNIISDQDYSFFFTNGVFWEDLGELICAPTA